jgi:hypothetical protein
MQYITIRMRKTTSVIYITIRMRKTTSMQYITICDVLHGCCFPHPDCDVFH